MDSFNLKQFLVENKLTENSKLNEIKTVPATLVKKIKALSYGNPEESETLTFGNYLVNYYRDSINVGDRLSEYTIREKWEEDDEIFSSANPEEIAQWLLDNKINEIKATPKNTGLTIPKQLATDLVNQTQPNFEEDEYIVISTPVSEVNPKFIKYLKSLPTDNDYPYQSGVATFNITYKGIEWKIMFYLVYADANYDIYDEDMVVFELS
jgi:hypothetical protein